MALNFNETLEAAHKAADGWRRRKKAGRTTTPEPEPVFTPGWDGERKWTLSECCMDVVWRTMPPDFDDEFPAAIFDLARWLVFSCVYDADGDALAPGAQMFRLAENPE